MRGIKSPLFFNSDEYPISFSSKINFILQKNL